MTRKYMTFLVALLVFYGFIPLALGDNFYLYSLLTASLVIAAVATAWSLLSNLGGMMSFGHAAFFGVGAYTSALLSMQWQLPVLLAMVIAAACTALVSLVMLPALRLSGAHFALAILAYAHIFRIIATEWRGLTGGAGGLTAIPGLPTVLGLDLGSNTGSYLFILTLVLLFVLTYHLIGKSHHGLALKAMHESEAATRVVGVNSNWLKTLMLLVSAFMTGLAGAFNAHHINFLEPSYAFDSSWTLIPIIAAICGGYRSIVGPLAGAIVIYLLDQLLFKNLIPTGHQIILGALLVAMIIYRPAGLVSMLKRRKPEPRHA